ncbi:hypothetical protein CRG98_002241 [Punica granatum]|uniref:Uncharacterized protein n=1 Tax=Punica granatum TaxID=22663 RepID=A0A2I0LAU0_PUNGR|nr:hypothetical protein CRG98_002241 [Punica granatum]
MALQLSSAYCTCFSGLCHRRRVRARRIRAVASKDFATLKAEEEKVTMLAIEACLGVAPATGITSNGMKKRLQDAYQKLKKGGVPLASNHSLICELGITLISYSSIPQGYSLWHFVLLPLLNRISEIGEEYINALVVLNWLTAREKVVPIPGSSQECRTLQAKDFAGAPGCRLNGPFLLAGIERVDVIIFCCSEVMGYEPSGEDLRYVIWHFAWTAVIIVMLKLPVASRSVVRSTTRVESYVQIAFVISSADLLLPIMTSYPFPNETSSLRLRYVSIHADLSLLTVE